MKKKSAQDFATLKHIGRLVDNMIEKRRPAFDSLTKVRNQLSELVVAAKSISARDPSVGDGLPGDFTAGLDAVILAARSFRSGYASNDASQQIEDLAAVPGFAPVNTVKSATAEKGKRVSVAEFTNYAAAVVKSLDGMDVPGQLEALRGLQTICRKANEEDFSDVLIPTSNDPDKQEADVVNGSVVAGMTGTAAPSTASTNFSADGTPAAGAPAGGTNASTGSVAALAGTGTGGNGGSDNFSVGGTPTASAAGGATGTGAVATAAAGAGETGTAATNFAATDVAGTGVQKGGNGGNGGAAPAAAVDPLVALHKAADDEEESVDWSGDLTGKRFMTGQVDPSLDFGEGNDLGLVPRKK